MQDRRKIGRILEYVSIALILLGFFAMIQPVFMYLYTIGFPVILSGVVLFNVASHV